MLKRSLNRRELGNIRRLHRLRRFCLKFFAPSSWDRIKPLIGLIVHCGYS
jgi:hypothetical protein